MNFGGHWNLSKAVSSNGLGRPVKLGNGGSIPFTAFVKFFQKSFWEGFT